MSSFIPHSKPSISKEDITAVSNTLISKHLEAGTQVREFENRVSKIINKKNALATSNGFGAIHLALLALDIGKGDEVIIPTYTCSALLNPIRLLNATPVLCDIDEDGFNINLEFVKKRITSKTKAIIIPHMFGFPANIESFRTLEVPIIEDCAHSIGASYQNKPLGSFGDITICSFYATKMLSAGDGGMLLTDNEEWYERAKLFHCYSGVPGNKVIALNYRYTNLNASLGISQLNKLNQFIQKRRKQADRYKRLLKSVPGISMDFQGMEESCYYRFPIAVDQRDQIKEKLLNKKIGAGFGVLENMHKLVQTEQEDEFPNANKRIREILSLPIYPSLLEEEQNYIVDQLKEIIDR